MGKTLRKTHLRKKRGRSLPCRRFCSCCSVETRDIGRKSSKTSVCKKKRAGSGRVLKNARASVAKARKTRQKTTALIQVNAKKDKFEALLKNVIVKISRLSDDVLNVLSEFGSICACEVDSLNFSCRSIPTKFVKSPSSTPTRRLRSTPVQPVERHTSRGVMDKLRVLNADWRGTTCPLNVNGGPVHSSTAPENAPKLSMKTLFLENLSICKRTPSDESVKENLKMQNKGGNDGSSQPHKTGATPFRRKIGVVSKLVSILPPRAILPKAADFKSLPSSTAPSKVHVKADSKTPSVRQTPLQQAKQDWKPKILGSRSKVCEKSNLPSSQNSPVKTDVQYPTAQVGKADTNRRKQSLNAKPVASESLKRAVSLCNNSTPLDADDCESFPKKLKVQESEDSSMPQSAARASPKNQIYTIVLSDSSDDEVNCTPFKSVVRKRAVAESNSVRKFNVPKRGSFDKASAHDSKAHCGKTSTKNSKNNCDSRVAERKRPRKEVVPRKKAGTKKTNRKVSDEYHSDSTEPPQSLGPRRTRGSWNGGCRSCPGCQIDAPRKQKAEHTAIKKKIRTTSPSSDSEVEVIKVIKPRGCVQKCESSPNVILHSLTSSDDSFDGVTDGEDLGSGRTAVVVVTGEVETEEETVRTGSGMPTISLQVGQSASTETQIRLPSSSNSAARISKEADDLSNTVYSAAGTLRNPSGLSRNLELKHPVELKHHTVHNEVNCDQLGNSESLEVQKSDIEKVCHEEDEPICSPEVKGTSENHYPLDGNVSKLEINPPPPESTGASNENRESQGDEVLLGVREPSSESDTSIATENLDSHDYGESDSSTYDQLPSEKDPDRTVEKGRTSGLSSPCKHNLNVSVEEHGDVMSGPQTSQDRVQGNTICKVSGEVSESPTTAEREPVLSVSVENSLRAQSLPVKSRQQSSDVNGGIVSQSKENGDSHTPHELPCHEEKPERSATSEVSQNIVSEMTAMDMGIAITAPGLLDCIPVGKDKSKEAQIPARTNGKTQDACDSSHLSLNDSDPNQPKFTSDVSHQLNDCLNDIVESVKLENREVIIRKATPCETADSSEAVPDSHTSKESESLAKELNLLVTLNPRLMIKKIPVLLDEAQASVEVNGEDSKCKDVALSPEVDAPPADHQVPENGPISTPHVNTPIKTLYERKGYPTPVKNFNPNVLSVIKYNELEIDNDEPSLNDPPETDLVECVSSGGVRFELNPDDLSTLENFLNAKPEKNHRVAEEEAKLESSLDDLVIDNDEPPLNQSPVKQGRPPHVLENDEDLEDLVIDNDAPPLNDLAEAAPEINRVADDSDCLVISSDDEVLQSGTNPQSAALPIAPFPLRKPRKKLFRKKCNNVPDSSSKTGQSKMMSFGQEHCTDVNETSESASDAVNEVLVDDCGIQTIRKASVQRLAPFTSSKNWLDVNNPLKMPISEAESHVLELPDENAPQEPANQLLLDLSDLEFLNGNIAEEVVIDDTDTAPSEPSWEPLPRLEGCQETLLQPQVYNLHGQPLNLNQCGSRDPGPDGVGNGNTESLVTIDLSETFKDKSEAERLNVSGSASDDTDVILVSPPKEEQNSTVKNVVCKDVDPIDSSRIALSDSDDDIIIVNGPERLPQANNRTRNIKPASGNPPVRYVSLSPQISRFQAPTRRVRQTLCTGMEVRAVPTANGGVYYVLVTPSNPLQLFPS